MTVSTVIQVISQAAFLLLGIFAVYSAIRRPERVRVDVALVFGALGLAVVGQEVGVFLPATTAVTQAVVIVGLMALPFLLIRLADDVADVPDWLLIASAILSLLFAVVFVVLGTHLPAYVGIAALLYLALGVGYAAVVFALRAGMSQGITSRRMWAITIGCLALAGAFLVDVLPQAEPGGAAVATTVSQISALISGIAFLLGFYPPAPLREAWRLPELFAYVRPPAATATQTADDTTSDALAMDRILAAVTRTTGARRSLVALLDPSQGDLFLWGAPSARVPLSAGIVGRAALQSQVQFRRTLLRSDLDPAIQAVVGTDAIRSAIAAPILLGGQVAGVIVAFAEKGPVFVDDDAEMLRFFAGEVANVLNARRYREAAQEIAALREADRLKDEFMAVVSHELRTPLTAISGYADILLRKLSGPLNERQQTQVQGVRDASRRLLSLVNDLLDVSKLEAGTLNLRLSNVDAQAAAERAVAGTRVIAANSNVTLHVQPPASPLPAIQADPDRLQQILQNLLSNAIKFSPRGGEVTVSLTAVDQPQAFVRLAVTDPGVGLTHEQQARVWDRFYQAESTATRRFGGTGLGLAIVKRLVELHHGQVHVSSPGLGQGSTFSVLLPAAQPAQQPQPPIAPPHPAPSLPANDGQRPAPEAPNTGAPLVLVAEDDPDIAAVLRTYLENDGYRVQLASNGQEALELARAFRPLAITLDVMLPRMDGWSLLNALKHDPLTADIPAIVISIIDSKEYGMVLGASDYLVKPVDQDRLRQVLRSVAGVPTPGDGTILLVDDDLSIREMLSQSLSQDGWTVRTAEDGRQALDALTAARPAAVILDLLMPSVSGFDVLQSVRADPRMRDLPVLVVTAKELTDAERDQLASAAQSVILKQALSMGELQTELRRLLAAFRARPAQVDPQEALEA